MSNSRMMARKSIMNRILAMKFGAEFILIYPLITIMFGERGHVDSRGIGIILGLGVALAVVLEIPTGIIADKIPRKFVLVASIVAKIAGLGLWLWFPFFIGYIFAAACFALGSALESGALQAYLYDTIDTEGKASFGKFWARVSAMVMISYTLAYLLTTLIGVNYPLLIVLSIVPCVIALGICFSLPTDTLTTHKESVKPKIFKSAVSHIKQSPELVKLILGGVIIVALAQMIMEYLSLYYHQLGTPTRYVSLLMAAGNIVGAALFWSLHSWEKYLDKYILILSFLAVGLFVASFYGGITGAVLGVMLITRFVRVLQVQYESNIQHLANDQARATISSIGSFGSSIIAAIIMASIGIFAIKSVVLVPIRISLVAGIGLYLILRLLSSRKKLSSEFEVEANSRDLSATV